MLPRALREQQDIHDVQAAQIDPTTARSCGEAINEEMNGHNTLRVISVVAQVSDKRCLSS